MHSTPRIYKKILKLTAVLVFCLILDYSGSKLFDYLRGNSQESYYYFDEEIGRLHVPDIKFEVRWEEASTGAIVFQTNNLGFREDLPTLKEKDAQYRIMVFGDSHTDGVVNNKDSFPNIAESLLNKDKPQFVEIINAGVGHSSLYQQFLLFKRLLYLKPDMVIFTFYIGNDYLEIVRSTSPHLAIENGKITPASAQWTFSKWVNNSLILRFFRRLDPRPLMQAIRVKRFAMWQSLQQSYYFTMGPGNFYEVSKMHNYVVQDILKTAQKTNINVLFIVLPTKYQIEGESDLENFSKIEAILHFSPENKFDDKVRIDFLSILENNSASFLDPYEKFIQSKKSTKPRSSKSLFWYADHHLSEEGHKQLGEHLAIYLQNIFNTWGSI
jgi:hypothetical protein